MSESKIEDVVLTLEQFNALSEDDQREKLSMWRTQFQNKVIQDFWGLRPPQYYNIIKKLKLPVRGKTSIPADSQGDDSARTVSQDIRSTDPAELVGKERPRIPDETLVTQSTDCKPPVQETNEVGFRTSLNGTYDADTIVQRLKLMAAAIEGTGQRYRFSLVIQDVNE